MPHVITNLCMRDGSCAEVCPVECIVPGDPIDQYPTYYIDPDTCIDCGACAAECPFSAIFPDEEVPADFVASGGEFLSMPVGTAGFTTEHSVESHDGVTTVLKATKELAEGEEVDLTPAIDNNAAFFSDGPGYGD